MQAPLMFIGFIMVLVGLFTSLDKSKIILEKPFRQTADAQKLHLTDAQLQCPECYGWNPISATYCKSCGTKLT